MSVLSESHRDNLVRWQPGIETGFYESHFMKVNLPEQQAAFWCRYTILHPVGGRGPAQFQVWAIYFDVANPARSCAARETFEAGQTHIERDRLETRFGENRLEHGLAIGSLRGAAARFRWELRWEPGPNGLRHFPNQSMYEAPLPKAKLLTPVLSAPFRGFIEIGDYRHELNGQLGMQGHNWGRKNAESWVWAHCNHFDSAGVVFEGVSSRIRVGPLSTPQLSILHFDDGGGYPITVNGWVSMVRTTSQVDGLRWRFRGTDGDRSIEGQVWAEPERFVGLHYHDPDGDIANCLNSKVADAEVRVLHRDGGIWRLRRTHYATASAALEIGVRDDTRGVRIHL